MIFKEKDKVFDALFGWGEVIGILQGDETLYPISVDFVSGIENYGRNGSFILNGGPTLSFTEYTLEGFSQERPLPFKVGDVVYLSGNKGSWRTQKLEGIDKDRKSPFRDCVCFWGYLALENPLKNPYTKIYTKEDL